MFNCFLRAAKRAAERCARGFGSGTQALGVGRILQQPQHEFRQFIGRMHAAFALGCKNGAKAFVEVLCVRAGDDGDTKLCGLVRIWPPCA